MDLTIQDTPFYAVESASADPSVSFSLRTGEFPPDFEDSPSPLWRIFIAALISLSASKPQYSYRKCLMTSAGFSFGFEPQPEHGCDLCCGSTFTRSAILTRYNALAELCRQSFYIALQYRFLCTECQLFL